MGCQVITEDAVITPNVLLLRAVLAHIETHPESWDQRAWRTETDCGTAYCYAGWAMQLTGRTWTSSRRVAVVEGEEPCWDTPGAVCVFHAGQRALGLTEGQASNLFFGRNRLADIRRIVADLIGQTHHVTIRVVPFDELVVGEEADGRSPLEIVEHRPGQPTITHGTERGIPLGKLTDHARAVADRLGVPYIDPIDPAAMERLARAEAA